MGYLKDTSLQFILSGASVGVPNFMAIGPIFVSLKSTNVNILVALDEKSSDHQSHRDSSCGNHECLQKMCQSINEIFQKDRPTTKQADVSIPRAMLLASLKIYNSASLIPEDRHLHLRNRSSAVSSHRALYGRVEESH